MQAALRQFGTVMNRICLRLVLLCIAAVNAASAQSVSRAEALKIAESFVQHHWRASPKNVLHGKDTKGIEVHTPDRGGGRGVPLADCWTLESQNTGVPYKWGGLDTPQSFDTGIKAGRAAGDVYTAAKRRLDGAGISDAAAGIDCSGFICRCWKLNKRFSTYSLGQICQKLPATASLEPADIMNSSGGHVLLFVKWLDSEKKRALFYESSPFSKTLASEREMSDLTAAGYIPLRYKRLN